MSSTIRIRKREMHKCVSDDKQHHSDAEVRYEDPECGLLDIIKRNEGFSPKRSVCVFPCPEDVNIFTTVNVLNKAPEHMEAKAQRVDTITGALLLCFPRVSPSALEDLRIPVPGMRRFADRMWPVFVNPTRACYQLFRALALPVSPSPMYLLEILARGWRNVPAEVLQCFIPTCTGGTVNVTRDHYTSNFLAPLMTLAELSLITQREKRLMIETFLRGVLPCFAGQGDWTASSALP